MKMNCSVSTYVILKSSVSRMQSMYIFHKFGSAKSYFHKVYSIDFFNFLD